ncbi:hypothetical protein OG217_14285 [Streptomyces sp. NBC_01023]|uniref:hypothetical protein n=1 Tax=Streptomyces sp. NBC_01023 TaxID=2903724 RepID=UPI00386B304D|nr:hypothetical protein OG217_14285 [Streptomyces sp. NBC_01023]
MRPRLLPDTHLLPSDRGVVISGPRHTAAFALPGIHPWLERLRPFLDGRSSLDQLTADLPPQAAQHVRALVELLAREGFVRDATVDLPHGLSPQVRAHHAALIDFIAARADSPEHRFERYRECAPLVVGTGRMASALVLALLASGVAHVRLGGPVRLGPAEESSGAATDVARLRECVALLQQEGGCFRYEQLSGDLSELPADVGVVLLGSDVSDPEPADRARALALRGGARYGQAVGRGEHIVISAVSDPGGASEPPATGGSPGSGPDRHGAGGAGADAGAGDPTRAREPSPYLGGPVAALAANQLCLHLLRRVAGLDSADGETDPSTGTDTAVLDLTTGRFLGAESE